MDESKPLIFHWGMKWMKPINYQLFGSHLGGSRVADILLICWIFGVKHGEVMEVFLLRIQFESVAACQFLSLD